MRQGLNRRTSLRADAGILFLWSWGFALVGYLMRGRISVSEALESLGAAIGFFAFGLMFLLGRRSFDNRLNSAIWASAALAVVSTLGSLN